MGLTVPRLSLRQRLKLLWGKVRRFYLGLARRRYVRDRLARRTGQCRRCGACCALGYRCLALRDTPKGTECRTHQIRPPNCRLFPIDERDLAARDLILPHTPCGFRFAPAPDDAPENARTESWQNAPQAKTPTTVHSSPRG